MAKKRLLKSCSFLRDVSVKCRGGVRFRNPDPSLVTYHFAKFSDLSSISCFVDFWLSGRGLSNSVSSSSNDFFVSKGLHRRYLRSYVVCLAVYKNHIIGWGVKTRLNVLIHLLVHGDFRGLGIGSKLLLFLNPLLVRSKSDHQTGNPLSFYKSRGFIKLINQKLGKKKNIDLLISDSVLGKR